MLFATCMATELEFMPVCNVKPASFIVSGLGDPFCKNNHDQGNLILCVAVKLTIVAFILPLVLFEKMWLWAWECQSRRVEELENMMGKLLM